MAKLATVVTGKEVKVQGGKTMNNAKLEQWVKQKDFVMNSIMRALLNGEKQIKVCEIPASICSNLMTKEGIMLVPTWERQECISTSGKKYVKWTYSFKKV